MNSIARQVCVLAEAQHDVVAAWQLRQHGLSAHAVREQMRRLRRVFRGVGALGDLTELGWFMAAALSMGPTGVISHRSGVQLMELCRYQPSPIHVSFTGGGRDGRDGLVLHRRKQLDRWEYRGIPVASPTDCLLNADLKPWELYRAIDIAERRNIPLSLPRNEVVRLKQRISGRTRSEAEARFLWLLHEHHFPLPRVNQHLNGYETDFHWPELDLVVEVDGWEHHRERDRFNDDRFRGLVHRSHGYEVIRVSADHVYDEPALVMRALESRV